MPHDIAACREGRQGGDVVERGILIEANGVGQVKKPLVDSFKCHRGNQLRPLNEAERSQEALRKPPTQFAQSTGSAVPVVEQGGGRIERKQ